MLALLKMFSIQEKLYAAAAVVLWSIGCFGSGYAYKWHIDSVKDAERVAVQDTAQVTADAGAKASDSVSINHLQSQLDASTSLTNRLLQQIKEQQNATPASDSCRLPPGLRDSINSSLAAGSR